VTTDSQGHKTTGRRREGPSPAWPQSMVCAPRGQVQTGRRIPRHGLKALESPGGGRFVLYWRKSPAKKFCCPAGASSGYGGERSMPGRASAAGPLLKAGGGLGRPAVTYRPCLLFSQACAKLSSIRAELCSEARGEKSLRSLCPTATSETLDGPWPHFVEWKERRRPTRFIGHRDHNSLLFSL